MTAQLDRVPATGFATRPAPARQPSGGPALAPAARARSLPATAVLIGALGGGLDWLGSWNPSFWGDEAASIVSAERSLPALAAEISHVDAVHGMYYLFLHFWIEVFGASPLSVRAPSAIAVAIAAAGVVVLGDMLINRPTAIVAGVVFAALPRVTWAATEARSYAMTATAVVWVTILLVYLIRASRPRSGLWIIYGVALAACGWLFLDTMMIIPIHAALLLSTRRGRSLWRPALRALVTAAIVVSPIAVLGLSEHRQIAFLANRDYATPPDVLVTQWFSHIWFAILGWTGVAGGVVVSILALRSRRRSSLRAGVDLGADAAALLLVWTILPTAALLVGNAVIAPMYNARYLTFCTPAVALVIAIAITFVAARTRQLGRYAPVIIAGALTALVVVVAVPGFVTQRTDYAKDGGSDWSELAATVARTAQPGDAIVFDRSTKPSQKPRLALRTYPQDFTKVDDVGLDVPYWQRAGLWDTTYSVNAIANRLVGHDRVLAAELRTPSTPHDVTELRNLGYREQSVIHLNRSDLYVFVKDN